MAEGTNGGALVALPTLAELAALRSDYEDVPVPQLGGTILRVYALTGTARAQLVGPMAELAKADNDKDPETVKRVWLFQGMVVGASLGYPEDEWSGVGNALGVEAISLLYDVAARLSALGGEAKAEAVQRLPRRRNAASG